MAERFHPFTSRNSPLKCYPSVGYLINKQQNFYLSPKEPETFLVKNVQLYPCFIEKLIVTISSFRVTPLDENLMAT